VYIRILANKYGMGLRGVDSVVLRVNEGEAVQGHTVLLGRGK